MGLDGYRTYRQKYEDNGEIVDDVIIRGTIQPDFKNHNTIQYWMLVPTAGTTPTNGVGEYIFNISSPLGSTLLSRTLHEITVKNPTTETVEVRFVRSYILVDETPAFNPAISASSDYEPVFIHAKGEAYFYCTAIDTDQGLTLEMRTGSQDNKG